MLLQKCYGEAKGMAEAKNLLRDLFKETMGQKTLPENLGEWGLSDQARSMIGNPARNLLQTAGSPISDVVCNVCKVLFGEAIEGRLTKVTQLKFSTGLMEFVRTVLGIEEEQLLLLEIRPSLDYSQRNAAVRLNRTCCNAILDRLRVNKNVDVGKVAEDVLSIIEQETCKTRGARRCVSNEISSYGRRFTQTLHLEGGRKCKASLKDLYIEPPFAVLAPDKSKLASPCGLERLVELFAKDELDDLEGFDSPCNALTILGQPGSGKTSLIQSLASRHLEKMFLPEMGLCIITLRELASSGFADDRHPIKWLESQLESSEGFRDSLIVLDGLDELSLVLSAGETIDGFYRRILDDAVSLGCKVVVTSRPNYIEPVFDENRNAWQTIEIENLTLNDAEEMVGRLECARGEKVSQKAISAIMSRWDTYQQFLGIPLLLYTVLALGIDMTQVKGRCGMYERIFEQMHRKAYSERGETNFAATVDPREIARALASEMRRKGRKYLDSQEASDVIKRFASDLASEEEGAIIENGYGMTFFYESGSSDRFAPEFLHQTFMEYLAAEKIYSSASKHTARDDEEAVQEWWLEFDYLLSGAQLSAQTVSFFCHLAKKNEQIMSIRDLTSRMLMWLVDVYAPAGMIRALSNDQGALEKSATLFVNYWRLVKAPNSCRPMLIALDWRQRKTFFDTFRVVSHVRGRNWINLTNEKLERMDLSYIDFAGCSLKGCNLKKANLTGCNFSKANLADANLEEAKTECACFDGAIFDSKSKSKRKRGEKTSN